MQMRSYSVQVALVVVVALLSHRAVAQPAFSYRSPFHPEQCERAIALARRRLAGKPQTVAQASVPASRERSRCPEELLLAEGLLCRGLVNDPAALDSAIALLRRIVADEPENFFAQLEYADALRKRFPLAEETLAAQRRARELLDHSDVGAARQELTAYIDENLAAVLDYRERMLPVLNRQAAAFAAETLPTAEAPAFLALRALAGPNGAGDGQRIQQQVDVIEPPSTRGAASR